MKKTRRRDRTVLEKILKVFREAQHPLLLAELADLLGERRAKRQNLAERLQELIDAGELVALEGGRFGLTAAMNLVVGQVSVHPDGFAFVTPEVQAEAGDIFINPGNLKEAWHGDKVVVRLEHRGRRGKKEGRIIRVLERRLKRIVGVLQEARGRYYVVPEDEHLLFDLVIPADRSLAKMVGQMVVAEITEYPAARLNPVGKIVEVLGPPEDPAVQVKVVILKHELPHEFPAAALRQARDVPQKVPEAACQGRLDLRHLPMVTIDGLHARDFDDGVALLKKPGGGFVLYVAIADVCLLCPAGIGLGSGGGKTRHQRLFSPVRPAHAAAGTLHRHLQPQSQRRPPGHDGDSHLQSGRQAEGSGIRRDGHPQPGKVDL